MGKPPIGQMPPEEFADLMEDFITKRSGQDDRLPGDVFFELLGRLEILAKVSEPSQGSEVAGNGFRERIERSGR